MDARFSVPDPMGCRLEPVSDKNKPPSRARSAGRGLGRLLEKLLGREGAGRLAESAEVLQQEFEEGKREREDPAPRTIAYREVDPADEAPAREDPDGQPG